MSERWERSVPVYDQPVVTPTMAVLCGLGALAVGLVAYREIAGLGPSSGMNDAYAWGIWKTFNTMVLTGLGSGAFSIGIAAWLFRRHRLHSVMRTALLTSFLAYASGLALLGIDVGRPWNFYWIFMPWRWNFHSPLLEVAFCMPVYAMIPLLLENVPPVLEWLHDRKPQFRPLIKHGESFIQRFYPWIVGLAYVLPAMHQSSLGALMLLAGDRVHPLWQTPWLPFLYLWAAAFLGFSCVAGTLLLCHLIWKRPVDMDVMAELNHLTATLIISWLLFRLSDIVFSGKLGLALTPNIYSGLFWIEVLFLAVASFMLLDSANKGDERLMFQAHVVAAVGGMLYRWNPTTLAFQPRPGAFYFPTPVELLISVGFVSLAIAGFVYAVKLLPILPGSIRLWYAMEEGQKESEVEAPVPEMATAD